MFKLLRDHRTCTIIHNVALLSRTLIESLIQLVRGVGIAVGIAASNFIEHHGR